MSEEVRNLFPKDMKYVDALPIANYIEGLKQENTQLKEELKYTVPIVEYNKIVSEKNKEINQLKSVLKEIREYIEKSSLEVNTKEFGNLTMCNSDDLLEIIDKAGIGEDK